MKNGRVRARVRGQADVCMPLGGRRGGEAGGREGGRESGGGNKSVL